MQDEHPSPEALLNPGDLLAVLEARFPELVTDEEMNGGDTVDALADWREQLCHRIVEELLDRAAAHRDDMRRELWQIEQLAGWRPDEDAITDTDAAECLSTGAQLLEATKGLATPVESLGLSCRSYNCLKNAQINTIKDLLARSKSDLLKSKNFGPVSLKEIELALDDFGFSLRAKEESE
jgi:hypothetical protein